MLTQEERDETRFQVNQGDLLGKFTVIPLLDALKTVEKDLHAARHAHQVTIAKLEVAEAREPFECSLCENDLEPADFMVCSTARIRVHPLCFCRD